MEVSEQDFNAYRKVQYSGKTNMMAVGVVSSLSGLPQDKIFNIMDNYAELEAKYGPYPEAL